MSKVKKAKQILNTKKISPKRAATALKNIGKGKRFI